MGRYNRLLIDRDLIDIHIGEYFNENGTNYNITDIKVLNECTGQTRYEINVEGKPLKIDFFFRKSDNTTTIQPIGNNESKELGIKIAEYIVNTNGCCNIKKGTVTLENVSQEQFDGLKDYLGSIEGVEVLNENNEANGCGQLWQIKSQIGDKITLTYYKKSGKLVSQGYMFKLFLEVTSFLTGLGLKFEKEVNDKNNNDDVELLVKQLLPNAYDKLDRLLIDFIYDSCSHINSRMECKDYSNWTFSALKGLEAFIKQILLKNNIRINDARGFVVRVSGEYYPIFKRGERYHEVDVDIIQVDQQSKSALEETYRHYHANRHRLFHTKQALQAAASARISNQSEAEQIVYKVCDLFDKYHYIII